MDANTIAIVILLGSFFAMILLRVPIAYAVGLSTVFCLMYMGKPLTTIPQQLVKGMWSFYLCMIVALLLLTFIPHITLWLPGLFM